MPGSPGQPFGRNPFGTTDWGEEAIWKSVPRLHRRLDERENDFLMKRMLNTLQDQMMKIRAGTFALPDQRDPLLARGGPGYPNIQIEFATAGNPTVFRTIQPHGFAPEQVIVFTDMPGVTGRHEVFEVISELEFSVLINTTADYDPATAGLPFANYATAKIRDPSSVTVQVVDAELIEDPDYGRMAQFTLAEGTEGDLLGVGYNSVFQYTDSVGNVFTFTNQLARMNTRGGSAPGALNSDYLSYIQCPAKDLPNQGPVDTPLPGAIIPDQPLFPQLWPNGYQLTFVRPGTLRALTGDFGITYDENDPEFFQRSSVANVVKYIEKKASEIGYEIRGDTVGFSVVAEGLWHLCEPWEGLPGDVQFEVDGDWFANQPPQMARFDEIAADIEYDDPQTHPPPPSETLVITDRFMYRDNSPDGFNSLKAWAQCTSYPQPPLTVTVVQPLTAVEAAFYNLGSGYKVVAQMTPEIRSQYGFFTPQAFQLMGPQPDDDPPFQEPVHYIIAEFYDAVLEEATFILDTPTTVPFEVGSYCLRYDPEDLINDSPFDCCWCRSYKMRIIATATEEFIRGVGGDGEKVAQALRKLIPRLLAEQVPIHVKVIEIILNTQIEVVVPPFEVEVGIGAALVQVIQAPFQAYYDEPGVDADDQPTDDVGPAGQVVVTTPNS